MLIIEFGCFCNMLKVVGGECRSWERRPTKSGLFLIDDTRKQSTFHLAASYNAELIIFCFQAPSMDTFEATALPAARGVLAGMDPPA